MASFQYGGLVEQVAVTATAAGTTTLTNVSKQIQIFTGTSSQIIVLPNATTMQIGQKFEIYNQSSAALSIEFNGGAAFTDAAGVVHGSLAANTTLVAKLQTNGTSAGTWSVQSTSVGLTISGPTVQKFLSGSGTYTTPTSPAPLYLVVEMVGGGGGGGGGGNSGGRAALVVARPLELHY